VFSGAAFLWAELACGILRRLGKPFILTLHGGSLPEFARKNPDRVRRLLRQSPIVTAPSSYLATELKGYKSGIRVVPNPLELSRYPFREPSERLSRVVWLRAFHAIYNPSLAVQCIAEARKRGVDLRLDMYGPDKGDGSRSGVESAIIACGVSDRVTLHGMVPKERIAETMAGGDLFLNTTDFDNTPVSVLEAMACGLPVVTTSVGGIPYLLKDGSTALLVPPRDPVSMASALCRVAGDPVLARSLAHQGRQLVEGFDWNRVLGVWEGLLGEIVPSK
jgi:glycosyltransferase involved in cell wall biosynthesis